MALALLKVETISQLSPKLVASLSPFKSLSDLDALQLRTKYLEEEIFNSFLERFSFNGSTATLSSLPITQKSDFRQGINVQRQTSTRVCYIWLLNLKHKLYECAWRFYEDAPEKFIIQHFMFMISVFVIVKFAQILISSRAVRRCFPTKVNKTNYKSQSISR